MRAIANLSVRGTRYYKADELLQKGSLSSGFAIRLGVWGIGGVLEKLGFNKSGDKQ
jgi:hypothetical protein